MLIEFQPIPDQCSHCTPPGSTEKLSNVPILHPLKAPEKSSFSGVFRWYTLVQKCIHWLKHIGFAKD